MPAKKQLEGLRYGRLVVVKETGRRDGGVLWLCRCDCGTEKEVTTHNLNRGHAKSCGCLQAETATIHGHSSKKIYSIYRAMMQRCYDKKSWMYHRYGGRGIKVCEDWANNIDSFIKWSEENGYSDSLQIDRIDNDKGYSPDNCRFVTKTVNANNTSKNIIIKVKGEALTIADAARRYGIEDSKLRQRITKLGWAPEQAIRNDVEKSPILDNVKKTIMKILSDGPKKLTDVATGLSIIGYKTSDGSVRRAKSALGVVTRRIGKTQTEWSLPAHKDAPRLPPSEDTLSYIRSQNIRHAKSQRSA